MTASPSQVVRSRSVSAACETRASRCNLCSVSSGGGLDSGVVPIVTTVDEVGQREADCAPPLFLGDRQLDRIRPCGMTPRSSFFDA